MKFTLRDLLWLILLISAVLAEETRMHRLLDDIAAREAALQKAEAILEAEQKQFGIWERALGR